MMIAGDLNVTTQWSAKHRSFLRGRHKECLARDRELFARFAALGFHNLVVRTEEGPLPGCECADGAACRHVQTQRQSGPSFPWQNDYVFVTADILERSPPSRCSTRGRMETQRPLPNGDRGGGRLSGACVIRATAAPGSAR